MNLRIMMVATVNEDDDDASCVKSGWSQLFGPGQLHLDDNNGDNDVDDVGDVDDIDDVDIDDGDES